MQRNPPCLCMRGHGRTNLEHTRKVIEMLAQDISILVKMSNRPVDRPAYSVIYKADAKTYTLSMSLTNHDWPMEHCIKIHYIS